MRTLKITLAALMIVTVAACSSDDGGEGASTEVSDEAKPYAEALATALTAEDGSDLILDQDQADCVGAKWVNVVTPERLEEHGFDPVTLADPDSASELNTVGLDEDEAGTMVDGFGECGVDLRALILDGLVEDEDLTDEREACFEDVVTEDAVKEFVVTSLSASDASDASDAGDEAGDGLLAALSGCLPGLGG